MAASNNEQTNKHHVHKKSILTGERKFILEFLELYQSFPSLWDVTAKDYNDKNVKREHYLTLLEKYHEWDHRATLEDMKKKINTLRTNYRREMNRLSNAPEGETSPLYYYNALGFLRICEDVKPLRKRSIGAKGVSGEFKPRLPKKHESPIKIQNIVDVMEEEPMEFEKSELYKTADDFDRLGETWASKLRRMDDVQQLWAEKFINDILLEGQLGNLHRHSVQIMESYPPTTSADVYGRKNEMSA